MNYVGIGLEINNGNNLSNNVVTDIKNINFVDGWGGAASDTLLTSLSDCVKKADVLKANFQYFSTILAKVEELMAIDAEIAELSTQLAGLDPNDEDNAALIAALQARIAALQAQRTALKSEIVSMVNILISAVNANTIASEMVVVDSYYQKLTLDEKKIALAEKQKNSQNNKNDLEGDEESSEVVDKDTVNDDEVLSAGDVDVTSTNEDYTVLTAPMGFNSNGPSGSETFCPLGVNTIVSNMEKDYGYSNLEWSIRDDGVKVLSGTTPDGENFENLVIVAADVTDKYGQNPDGMFDRGDIVETSLGKGIIIDYCERSVNMRKADGSVHFDIYTAWWEEPYKSQIYGND